MRKTYVLIAVVFGLVLIGFGMILGSAVFRLRYSHQATINVVEGLRVYLDEGLTSEIVNGSLLDWGNVSYGLNTVDLWVENVANHAVALNMSHVGLPVSWLLSWNCTGVVLDNLEVAHATLTLDVPSNATAGDYFWGMDILY